MAEEKVRALVLREVPFGDFDAYQSLLTREGRRIEVFCKNLRRKKKIPTGARQFCDSTFFLWEKNGKYRLREAEVCHDFWDLTQNIEHYALACYLCEVTAAITDDQMENAPLYELLWRAFYALTPQGREVRLVKAAFEWRAMAESGYAADLHACHRCGKPLTQGAYFADEAGVAFCAHCAPSMQLHLMPLSATALQGACHIMGAAREKLYAFALSGKALGQVCDAAERYCAFHLDRRFQTLPFYHSLVSAPAEAQPSKS